MQKSFSERLLQVDLSHCSPAELAKMPSVFVPIRNQRLNGAEIKYLVHKCGRRGQDLCFRLQAVRDFETREGRAVRAGEWGGTIDNRSFIPHKDLSWVGVDSFLYGSCLEKDSLLKSNSRVEDSRICSSLVEQSLIVNGAPGQPQPSETARFWNIVRLKRPMSITAVWLTGFGWKT